jgi:hypothetical protein
LPRFNGCTGPSSSSLPCSSPLSQPNHLRFVFNTIEIPSGDGRVFARLGLCTGWLSSLNAGFKESLGKTTLEDNMENLQITENNLKVNFLICLSLCLLYFSCSSI